MVDHDPLTPAQVQLVKDLAASGPRRMKMAELQHEPWLSNMGFLLQTQHLKLTKLYVAQDELESIVEMAWTGLQIRT